VHRYLLPMSGAWKQKEQSRREAARRAVAMLSATLRVRSAVTTRPSSLAILFAVFHLVVLAACVPNRRPSMPSSSVNCSSETRYTVQGIFGAYFHAHGGAESFGCPMTGEFMQRGLRVQYFEKARMEHHPENRPRFWVQLGLLGETLGRREPPIPSPQASLVYDRSRRYYPQTGHVLRQPFLSYYDSHGGLDRFGYPLCEAYAFRGALVQDFQRSQLISRDGDVQIGDWGRAVLSLSR
jgi:hypothetical protein